MRRAYTYVVESTAGRRYTARIIRRFVRTRYRSESEVKFIRSYCKVLKHNFPIRGSGVSYHSGRKFLSYTNYFVLGGRENATGEDEGGGCH